MKNVKLLGLGMFILFTFLAFEPPVFGGPLFGSLQAQWEAEVLNPLEKVDDSVLKNLSQYHVVLVSGILNEASIATQYFEVAKQAVENELGMSVTKIYPSSLFSPLYNSYRLGARIRNIYASINKESEFQKKIILVGHSKGGVECFFSVLQDPDLILQGMIEKVIVLQAPVKGTPLLDGERLWKPLEYLKTSIVTGWGLSCFEPEQAKGNLDFALEALGRILEHQYGSQGADSVLKKRNLISERIFYVRSYEEPQNLLYWTLLAQWCCGNHLGEDGPNDGLVRLEDQKDDRIGIDLGVIKAEHGALVLTNRLRAIVEQLGYPEEPDVEKQKAFFRAMFIHVVEMSSSCGDM